MNTCRAWRGGERPGWLRLGVAMTLSGAANAGLWAVFATLPGMPPLMYWPMIAVGGVLGAAGVPPILWWARRYRARMLGRLPPVACAACGYDLAGLPSESRCPMCGQTERLMRPAKAETGARA